MVHKDWPETPNSSSDSSDASGPVFLPPMYGDPDYWKVLTARRDKAQMVSSDAKSVANAIVCCFRSLWAKAGVTRPNRPYATPRLEHDASVASPEQLVASYALRWCFRIFKTVCL